MTRVAWLADLSNTDGTGPGGAEMTQAEFRSASPKDAEVVYVPKTGLDAVEGCDIACVFNVAHYPEDTIQWLKGKRVVRYWNDVAPHGSPELTRWLLANSTNVFCSPLHWERFPWRNGNDLEYHLIPPPVDLAPFRKAGDKSKHRAGACSVAPWRGYGKVPFPVQEWARTNGPVDFYGAGQCAPPGSVPVPYDQLPELLARYQTFVYLPTLLEPFCRTAAEAWAAGLDLVLNGNIGARYWLEENPGAIDTALQDFWKLVLS
jgi:hypothetical protein